MRRFDHEVIGDIDIGGLAHRLPRRERFALHGDLTRVIVFKVQPYIRVTRVYVFKFIGDLGLINRCMFEIMVFLWEEWPVHLWLLA